MNMCIHYWYITYEALLLGVKTYPDPTFSGNHDYM